MTSYVSMSTMTSYTLTRVTAYLHCDVMGSIANRSNRTSDRGKSLLISIRYRTLTMKTRFVITGKAATKLIVQSKHL